MAPFLHNGLNYGKERCQNDVVADSEAISALKIWILKIQDGWRPLF